MSAAFTPGSLPSRAAALGLLVLLLLAIYALVISPVMVWVVSYRGESARQAQMAYQMETLSERAAERIRELPASAQTPEQVLSANDPAPVVAAALQSQLRDLLASQATQLQSFAFLGATEEDGLERLDLEVVFETGFEQTVLILRGVEAPGLGLEVRGLDLRAIDERGSDRLRATAILSAYRLPPQQGGA